MNKVEQIYELLKELYSSKSKDDYDYLHWIVTHTDRDYMKLLYKQLHSIYGESHD